MVSEGFFTFSYLSLDFHCECLNDVLMFGLLSIFLSFFKSYIFNLDIIVTWSGFFKFFE